MAQRPVSSVPLPVMAMLVFCLAAQIGWRSQQGLPLARAQDLPPVPAAESYRLTGLGDPLPLAQATAMWLQAFDNQPGVSVPYRELDFEPCTHVRPLLVHPPALHIRNYNFHHRLLGCTYVQIKAAINNRVGRHANEFKSTGCI